MSEDALHELYDLIQKEDLLERQKGLSAWRTRWVAEVSATRVIPVESIMRNERIATAEAEDMRQEMFKILSHEPAVLRHYSRTTKAGLELKLEMRLLLTKPYVQPEEPTLLV